MGIVRKNLPLGQNPIYFVHIVRENLPLRQNPIYFVHIVRENLPLRQNLEYFMLTVHESPSLGQNPAYFMHTVRENLPLGQNPVYFVHTVRKNLPLGKILFILCKLSVRAFLSDKINKQRQHATTFACYLCPKTSLTLLNRDIYRKDGSHPFFTFHID